MNSLLSQLLIRLAQKEAAEKKRLALVQSLEILAAALISSFFLDKLNKLVSSIDMAMKNLPRNLEAGHNADIDLLNNNITRITAVARWHKSIKALAGHSPSGLRGIRNRAEPINFTQRCAKSIW